MTADAAPPPSRGQFTGSGDSYGQFMGRYSEPLAPLFADFAGIASGARVLDVGCGPGALTAELARRVGPAAVAAIDPAPQFVERCRSRVPEADVRDGAGEELPFADDTFDAALSQLVASFMRDASVAAAEMTRVVRPGGTIAMCMWAAGQMDLLRVFWEAASAVRPDAEVVGDLRMRYRTEVELEGLLRDAGLAEVEIETLSVETQYANFDDFWGPLQTAAGPVAVFFESLDDHERARLQGGLRERLGSPAGEFSLAGSAIAVRGRVGG